MNWLVVLVGLVIVAGIYLYSERPVPAAVPWDDDYEAALAQAAERNQPMLVEFKTSWCGACKWMDREVFSRPEAAKLLENWVVVQLDAGEHQRLSAKHNITAVPTFVAVSPKGEVMARHEGPMPLDELSRFIQSVEKVHNANL